MAIKKKKAKSSKQIFKPNKLKNILTLAVFVALALATYSNIQESHLVLCGPLLTNENLSQCQEIINQQSILLTLLAVALTIVFYISYSYLENK